jgi:hypothetical protein
MANPSPPPNAGASVEVADVGGRGGRLATMLSALALAFSGFSFYESVLKVADLEVYVPPVIHYGRDGGGDVELFAIPITIANDGARTGTVLSMELEVADLNGARNKRYYSAYMGEHPRNADVINRAFAPLSIAGKATFTDTVRFYPVGNPLPKVVQEAGSYKFTLKLETARPTAPDIIDRLWRTEPQPLSFEMTMPWISDQHLDFRRGSTAMHQKDHRPSRAAAPPAGNPTGA